MMAPEFSGWRTGATVLLATLFSACSFGGPAYWVEDLQTHTVKAQGVDRIKCRTHNGDVSTAGAASAETIEVMVKTMAGGRDEVDAKDCLAAIEVQLETRDETLWLSWDWKSAKASDWGAQVSFDVRHPKGLALVLRTHNGDVKALDADASMNIATHNGDVRLQGRGGPTKVSTHNGDVHASIEAPHVKVMTHNGDVHVGLTGQRMVEGELKTFNGDVVLALDSGLSTEVACRTSNGGVYNRAQQGSFTVSERTLNGIVGSGGGRLEVESNNGSITVR